MEREASFSCRVVAGKESRVEHSHIPKGDITCCYIVITGIFFFNIFKNPLLLPYLSG